MRSRLYRETTISNNPDARRYTADGAEKVESITADEFRDIYADFGYVAADSGIRHR